MTLPNFKVAYRAPGVVDLLIPRQPGVDGYQINGSVQFDGDPAFVPLFTAGASAGYLDPAVDRGRLHYLPGTDRVRAVFSPASFGAGQPTDAGLVDAVQFWLTMQPVVGGVPGVASAPALVLSPDQVRRTERVVIHGVAPAAADVSGALVLFLGRRMGAFNFANIGPNPLYVGYGVGGPEMQVGSGLTRSSAFGLGSTSTLVVRGVGGPATFTADFATFASW